MAILIAGAGFSKWAANLPLAKELFDFAIKPFGIREEEKLSALKKLKSFWESEYPLQPAEAFIDFSMRRDSKCSKLVIWYIVRRLSDPYIWEEWHAGKMRRHVLKFDENRKNDRPGVQQVRDFLTGVFGMILDGIVTTNYDLLIEYALGTKGFNYGMPGECLVGGGPYPLSNWLHPVILDGRVPLAKVHGSISWDATTHYTDGRRGLTGDALIMAPVPGKIAPAELRSQWDLISRIINKASCIVVFGFAFNPYDMEFLDHLRTQSKSVKHVLLIDINPNETAAKEIWPAASIKSLPPPPESASGIRNWLSTNH